MDWMMLFFFFYGLKERIKKFLENLIEIRKLEIYW